ncbi:NitT/TauT family transport system ATP-binding protein [Desulforamulus aeronauticus DSM 10349]|uniref:NitT/TauT family transport system ATP-binding protein n=1 Tax=Desulforamulus aeronauticus DSM 10349 TaxID=1121421 RepID=A0A1M6TFQ8_9FIRM|nr:NitT/TauT family transport system ATP-binding protein [Desulforamulus aeronauticus DSM 10349]
MPKDWLLMLIKGGECLSFLQLDCITYSYPGEEAIIKEISWQIARGEFHCLLGKSGCGKTTLLKLAAGLLPAAQGKVYLQGEAVVKPSPQAGFVFQAPTLLEWKTVLDNVLLPISLKRTPTSEDYRRAEDLLGLMGLPAHLRHYPTELSGGQQSRVAIARALIEKPAMLFLDEPFAALDAITREELQDDLLKLCQLQGITVLFITHDIAEALYLADQVAVMVEGQITFMARVDLAKPRHYTMRYGTYLNELGREVRQAISGGAS